jgi:hypothetical protein
LHKAKKSISPAEMGIMLQKAESCLRSCDPGRTIYNFRMTISEQIQRDITAAMKAREEHRLSALRMVKTALKHREVEKMAPLDDKESLQVLSTLIKQRKESAEQFRQGGRDQMAEREEAEIILIGGEGGNRRNGHSDDERHGHCHEECHGTFPGSKHEG